LQAQRAPSARLEIGFGAINPWQRMIEVMTVGNIVMDWRLQPFILGD
jgi:hypothetical protein